MGRGGQREMAKARVSSDALPALLGRRRVGAAKSGRISGKQGGTAEIVFSVLVPLGEQGLFILHGKEKYPCTLPADDGVPKQISQIHPTINNT